MRHIDLIADGLIAAVKGYVQRAHDGLARRMDLIEGHLKALPAPLNGRDGRDGVDGKDAPAVDVELIVADAVKLIPVPLDGKQGPVGDKGEPGLNGRDFALDNEVVAVIQQTVEAAVGALPVAKDGEPGINGKDGAPGINGKDGEAGSTGKDGAHGIEGKQGPAGKDGTSIHPDTVALMVAEQVSKAIEKAIAAMPVAKDGRDGVAGRDALELNILPQIDETRSYPRGTWARHAGGLFAAISDTHGMRGWECIVNGSLPPVFEQLSERSFVAKQQMSDGTVVSSAFSMPVAIYRGVYEDAGQYDKGDLVTYGGSVWHCDTPGKGKPGDPDSGWTLAVKKGRDGKPAGPVALKSETVKLK